jgi:hypothetical protein
MHNIQAHTFSSASIFFLSSPSATVIAVILPFVPGPSPSKSSNMVGAGTGLPPLP